VKQEILEAAAVGAKAVPVAVAGGYILGYTLGDAAALAALVYTCLLIFKVLFSGLVSVVRWVGGRKTPQP
jgi:hypothetical protein